MHEPSQAERLRQEIQRWISPPGGDRAGRIAGRQITRLLHALEIDGSREDLHLSALAEAQFARHMLHAGCILEFEAPTPSGRHADFRVERDGAVFYVHIKRLWVGQHAAPPALPREFEPLEAIARPVVIGVRWLPTATGQGLARIAAECADFAAQASVGDELTVRDEHAQWLGTCKVLAPHSGEHVALRAWDDGAEDAAVPRAQRLLRRAYGQFMPGAPNVICVVGDGPASANALETALLGSVVERWDRFPPRGRRVAHGRAHDGFWARGQFSECELVAWLPMSEGQAARVWRREDSTGDARAEAIIREALGVPATAAASAAIAANAAAAAPAPTAPGAWHAPLPAQTPRGESPASLQRRADDHSPPTA